MAKSPITVVWASTTSNKAVLDTTAQGNGIVFESDIVSNIINEALFLNSQATRNLQVMGGYYDSGQEYKNYQYCSQIEFVGGEYVLNYYMATQDKPTLAPTNATTYQQGTTDMEIPTNGSSVQSGWRQLNTVPNQGNIAYKNKGNTFTEKQIFTNGISVTGNGEFKSTLSVSGNTSVGGVLTAKDLLVANKSIVVDDTVQRYDSQRSMIGSLLQSPLTGLSFSTPSGDANSSMVFYGYGNSLNNRNYIRFQLDYSSSQKLYTSAIWMNPVIRGSNKSQISLAAETRDDGSGCPYLYWAHNTGANIMQFRGQNIKFIKQCVIGNANFGTVTRGIDPAWEQDYATANYVNQKLQELFDYLDTRLATIENKLGISSAKSRARGGIDARAMINNIAVPKSKIAELFDRLENLEGYEGVLGYSNAEERLELSKVKDNEEAVMQVMDSIKARMEAEAKEREAQEAQQNENPSQKTRETKSKIKE